MMVDQLSILDELSFLIFEIVLFFPKHIVVFLGSYIRSPQGLIDPCIYKIEIFLK